MLTSKFTCSAKVKINFQAEMEIKVEVETKLKLALSFSKYRRRWHKTEYDRLGYYKTPKDGIRQRKSA